MAALLKTSCLHSFQRQNAKIQLMVTPFWGIPQKFFEQCKIICPNDDSLLAKVTQVK